MDPAAKGRDDWDMYEERPATERHRYEELLSRGLLRDPGATVVERRTERYEANEARVRRYRALAAPIRMAADERGPALQNGCGHKKFVKNDAGKIAKNRHTLLQVGQCWLIAECAAT